MANCSSWKVGREKKSPPVVVAKEHTGMFTVLVCNVVEVQRIETLSYDTGEKASGSILKLKVRVLNSMKYTYRLQAVPVRNQLKLKRILAMDLMKAKLLLLSVQTLILRILLVYKVPQNSLKKVILTAVINALKVMDESGSSIKTFAEILNYGKTMLFTLIDESVDVDVLSAMWPKN